MWPGSDTNYNPPDMVVKYNNSMTTKEKMDVTLQWLDLPYDDRPQMISVYVPQIDQEGHRGGPFGSKVIWNCWIVKRPVLIDHRWIISSKKQTMPLDTLCRN